MGRLGVSTSTTSSGGGASLALTAYTTSPDGGASIADHTMQIDTSVDTASIAQILPGQSLGTGMAIQRVGWRVTVDGVDVTPYLTASPVEVSRSISNHVQVGTFSVVADVDGFQPLGSVWNQGAPITGLKPITISMAYLLDDGSELVEPLLTGAIADTSQRSYQGRRIDTVTVHDCMAKYLDVPVTLQVEAGESPTRDSLVERILTAMGYSNVALKPIGGNVSKAIDIAKGDGISLAQALAEVKGRQILADRFGVPTTVSFAHEESPRGPIRWQLTMKDLVYGVNGASAGGFLVRPKSEAFTKVTARGSKQVVRSSNCGLDTVKTESTTSGPYQPEVFGFQQDGAGAVTSTGFAALPLIDRTLIKTETSVTEDCGTLVSTVSETERLILVGSAREQRLADGTNSLYYTCFLRQNLSGEPGFAHGGERFLLADRTIETLSYDSQGFLSKKVTEQYGYYNPKTHLQARTLVSQAWGSRSADGDYNHNGVEGVVQQAETFQLIERHTEDYRVSGGYIEQKTVSIERFGRKRGVLYYYADGEYGEASETFQEVSNVIETYRSIGEALTEVTVLERTITGEPRATTFTKPGSPPTARKTSINAFNADRFEQQEITASCDAPNLLAVRPKRESNESYWEMAENEQELQAICDRLLMAGLSPEIQFTVLANARITEGDWGHLSGESGIELDFFVRNVTHSGSPAGPILTSVIADVPPGGVAGP